MTYRANEILGLQSSAGFDAAAIARTYKGFKLLPYALLRFSALLLDIFISFVSFSMLLNIPMLSKAFVDSGDLFFVLLVTIYLSMYFVVLEGRWGITLGKLVMQIRVVDLEGRPPSYLQAFLRMLLRLVDVPLFIGFTPAGLVLLFSECKQRLGDRLAETYVLYASDVLRLRERREGRS
jgi:uncharacterized RDD family membrane protein YckC